MTVKKSLKPYLKIDKSYQENFDKAEGMLKVITIHTDKGGTGKSTHTYQFASFCAEVLGKKVLVLDGDASRNLTNRFGVTGKSTISDIFDLNKKFEIYSTGKKNIDIIIGDRNFTETGLDVDSWGSKYLEFYYWIGDNIEFLEREYDFIVIDTHNDRSRVTLNLLVGTDVILNVLQPEVDSYDAFISYEQDVDKVVEPLTLISVNNGRRRSSDKIQAYNNTRLALVNRVRFFGNNILTTHDEFLEVMKQQKEYIGFVPEREKIISESSLENKSIFELFDNLKDKRKKESLTKFLSNISQLYLKVVNEACIKCYEKNNI